MPLSISFPTVNLSRARCFCLLAPCILSSTIVLILSAVVTAGIFRRKENQVQVKVSSPAVKELLLPSVLALLWIPTYLLMHQRHYIFDYLLLILIIEFTTWAFYLGGAAALAQSHTPVLRAISGFSFISFILLTGSLFILITSILRQNPNWRTLHYLHVSDILPPFSGEEGLDAEMGQTRSRSIMSSTRPSIRTPQRSFGSLRSNLSNASVTTSQKSQTRIPTSSSAWPVKNPKIMSGNDNKNNINNPSTTRENLETFRTQNSTVRNFLESPRTVNKNSQGPIVNYQPRRPLPDPDEDNGEIAQWAKANAGKMFQENFERRYLATSSEDEDSSVTPHSEYSIREASWVSVAKGPRGVAIARDMGAGTRMGGQGRGIQYPARAVVGTSRGRGSL